MHLASTARETASAWQHAHSAAGLHIAVRAVQQVRRKAATVVSMTKQYANSKSILEHMQAAVEKGHSLYRQATADGTASLALGPGELASTAGSWLHKHVGSFEFDGSSLYRTLQGSAMLQAVGVSPFSVKSAIQQSVTDGTAEWSVVGSLMAVQLLLLQEVTAVLTHVDVYTSKSREALQCVEEQLTQLVKAELTPMQADVSAAAASLEKRRLPKNYSKLLKRLELQRTRIQAILCTFTGYLQHLHDTALAQMRELDEQFQVTMLLGIAGAGLLYYSYSQLPAEPDTLEQLGLVVALTATAQSFGVAFTLWVASEACQQLINDIEKAQGNVRGRQMQLNNVWKEWEAVMEKIEQQEDEERDL